MAGGVLIQAPTILNKDSATISIKGGAKGNIKAADGGLGSSTIKEAKF